MPSTSEIIFRQAAFHDFYFSSCESGRLERNRAITVSLTKIATKDLSLKSVYKFLKKSLKNNVKNKLHR